MPTFHRFSMSFLVFAVLTSIPCHARELTFEERVQAQEAIERVYYSHQLEATKWFEEAVPRTILEHEVRTYLTQSVALERFWHTPITSEALRKELERMARGSRLPERLREIYAALGYDSVLIQECLARPALVSRLARSFFASDARIHSQPRAEAEALRARLLTGDLDPQKENSRRTVVEIPRGESRPSGARKSEQGFAPVSRIDLAGIGSSMSTPLQRAPDGIVRGVGEPFPVVEEQDSFVVKVKLNEDPQQTRWAVYRVPKIEWEEWWEENQGEYEEEVTLPVAEALDALPGLRLQGSAVSNCPPGDFWENRALDILPTGRRFHTAVWTGSVMIVWGGDESYNVLTNTGARYDPATDTWSATTTVNAPDPRIHHSAVWTGSEMIVWGGVHRPGSYFEALNTGGRYDPHTDTWTTTSLVDAPDARDPDVAVWTGREMIIWGGGNTQGALNSGARYDPSRDVWTPMSNIDAPPARFGSVGVWTGNLMIVWGGRGAGYLNSGGRYDPVTDSWSPTSMANAPEARYHAVAVWTGNRMVIWAGLHGGGRTLRSGGLYDPQSDIWTTMNSDHAPLSHQSYGAIWTGTKMLVWGGDAVIGQAFGEGGIYDPGSDSWQSMSSMNAPATRNAASVVWTGSLMIVWGGRGDRPMDTGGRYDPASDTWTPVVPTHAPAPRTGHSALWTGHRMVIWGGRNPSGIILNDGGRYDPALDVWLPISRIDAPSPRAGHTVVWTGQRMVLWGGMAYSDQFTNTGARYDPIADNWAATSTVDAPSPTSGHVAFWTGARMLIWGGLSSGGQYDPATDSWAAISTLNAPPTSFGQTAVWTGHLMIVWGRDRLNVAIGGRYDPVDDSWTPMSFADAPSPRYGHTAVWDGHEMLVWGGYDQPYGSTNSGRRYDPNTDAWTRITTTDAPLRRLDHTAVWTGTEMVVWGGYSYPSERNSGGRYDPASDTWTSTTLDNVPAGRSKHTAVWTGESMIVWGGEGQQFDLNTGGQYYPGPPAGPFTVDAGVDVVAECVGPMGAEVSLKGTSLGCEDPDEIVFTWVGPFPEGGGVIEGASPTVTLPPGLNIVTLNAVDEKGRTATDSMMVEVIDTAPPDLSLIVTPAVLWPPNHRMVPVRIAWEVSDACDPEAAVVLASVTSSEPDDDPSSGDGATTGDIREASIGTADPTILLRAERSGNGPGRTYSLTYIARDASANTASALGIVSVPSDLGTRPEPIMMSVEPGGSAGQCGPPSSNLRRESRIKR